MSVLKRLQTLNLPEDAMITLIREEGTDVFVHNETEVDTALSDTDVVNSFVSLITTPGLRVSSRWSGEIMESLRSDGHLDDYERGSFTFEDYLTEFFTENFYDQEFIEYSTEKYDHKRGFTTLTCSFSSRASDVLSNLGEYGTTLSGWQARVKTPTGTLTFDV